MKNHHIQYSVVGMMIIALAFGLGILAIVYSSNNSGSIIDASGEVTTFEECVAAGFPVMESYPEKCAAYGEVFVRVIQKELSLRNEIQVEIPTALQDVYSPFFVKGVARGPWFFEGSFSAELIDETGDVLGVSIIQAQEPWMTEELVPFTGQFGFTVTEPVMATIVLKNANPSDLRELDKELTVPVRLLPAIQKTNDISSN